MKKSTLFSFLGVACLAVGCASGSHIITGNARAAVMADAVRIYTASPDKFEVIGTVNAYCEGHGQSSTDAALKELKKQAAKIGANGILLGGVGNTPGQSTVGMVGTTPLFLNTGGGVTLTGQAIFVP